MFYKVIGNAVQYIDGLGHERRAVKGNTIYLENRGTVKKLLAEKAIELCPDAEVKADRNLVLREDDDTEEDRAESKAAATPEAAPAATLEGEITADGLEPGERVKLDGQEGIVQKVLDDGKVRVKVDGKTRTVDADKLEVA